MNTVGLYQNYMTSFQEMNQAGRNVRKTEDKKEQASAFRKPEAVYERTSTDEDIRRIMEKKEKESASNIQGKKEDFLENFTISKKNDVELSDKAQDLLEQLKKKYTNMDFFVANYSTEEEAQHYLSQGTKEYSVVIDPDTLEKMAEDEETFRKYDSILASAGDTFDEVKEKLGEDVDKVTDLGISIDGDGRVTLFAELDKQAVKQAESQKKIHEQQTAEKKEKTEKEEEKAAEKKAEEAAKEKKEIQAGQMEKFMGTEDKKHPGEERMTFRVTGSTVEELVAAIKNAALV